MLFKSVQLLDGLSLALSSEVPSAKKKGKKTPQLHYL